MDRVGSPREEIPGCVIDSVVFCGLQAGQLRAACGLGTPELAWTRHVIAILENRGLDESLEMLQRSHEWPRETPP